MANNNNDTLIKQYHYYYDKQCLSKQGCAYSVADKDWLYPLYADKQHAMTYFCMCPLSSAGSVVAVVFRHPSQSERHKYLQYGLT